MGTGRLVEIEGIDGSGKTVQTELLRARLEAAGRHVSALSFPRYGQGFFADLVARYLGGEFGGDPASVSPWLAALPYACDRWEASAGIREALASGAVVLCNRYVSANMGHQGAKLADEAARGEFFAWVARLEYEVFGVPRPDVQVWLDVPVSVSLELIRARGRGGGRPEEDIHQTEAHLVRARASYEQMTRQFGGWVRVACCGQAGLLAPETISDMIWERIGEKLE